MIMDMPTGVIIVEKEGMIIGVNREMIRLLDPKDADIEGTLIFDIMDPADIPGLLEILNQVEADSISGMNVTFRMEEGRTVTLRGSFSWTGDRDLQRMICSFCEPGAEEDDRSISRRAFEELPFPVTILNKRLEPIFQNSASDEQISLVSKRRDPIRYPTKKLKEALMRALREGKGTTVDFSLALKDGKREFDVIITPIYHGDVPDQVMEIWMDVVPEVDIGTIGGQGKGLSNELLETSNAVIIGIDMEGRIKLFNNGAKRALEYEPETIQGTVWFDYLVDKDAEQGRLEVFQWNIGSGIRTQYESKVRSETGRTRTLLLENTVIFDRKGEISMILMVGQDVTRTKNLEKTLMEQREKLADAMEELNLYNDLMIHDIHNSNAGIQGYLELLRMEGIPEANKRAYVDRALAEVKKSSSIIKDVKIMSRSHPDGGSYPVSLDEMLRSSIENVSKDHEITIEWEGSDFKVMADKVLYEAFTRIFEKAIENSTRDDLKITVSAKRDPSRSNLMPQPVHLTFTDNGGGISEKMKESLLERPSSTELGSHMLGLFLANKIISNHNGMVWIERIQGGMEVHVVLTEAS